VIDPSIGREKMKDFAANPWLMRRVIGDGAKANTLGDLLQWAGIEPEAVKLALVTHVHWDHIGGAIDVPSARILMREPDLSWSDHAKIFFGPAVPPHEVARIRSRIQEFKAEGPAYEGFASSYDLFGDGSIVGVPTPGHTPGSTSWFVNSGDGRRWLFVGDAAWDHENVELPAHKGWKGRFADNDKEKTGETLALLHAFAKARPVKSPPDGIGVQLVPAHDASVLSTLPVCVR
jgi:glyoxylase-like metal-dependent hydrolase (beta-lactamase superfamily II)